MVRVRLCAKSIVQKGQGLACSGNMKMNFLLFAQCFLLCEAVGNIDVTEPTVLFSPAVQDPNDGFGWSVVLHQISPVLNSDNMEETLRKTRYDFHDNVILSCKL